MRQHPRMVVVATARVEIVREFLKVQEKHNLTHGETVGILAELLTSEAKWMIRMERHGDYDKPGGLMPDMGKEEARILKFVLDEESARILGTVPYERPRQLHGGVRVKKMVEMGWLEVDPNTQDRPIRERIYRCTELGQELLDAWKKRNS